MRADVARALLPHVEDTAWFFDTELLVLAERSGLRIHEVPVDWVDDPDSRVDIVATAMADLRGVARLGRALLLGDLPVHELREQLGRGRVELPGVPVSLARQSLRFAAIGVLSTLAYLLLFLLARPMGAQAANLFALLVTAVANTAANRRFTFGVRGAGCRATSGAGAGRVRPGPGADERIPRRADRIRRSSGPRDRAHRARRGQPRGHRAAVRPAPRLGLPPQDPPVPTWRQPDDHQPPHLSPPLLR